MTGDNSRVEKTGKLQIDTSTQNVETPHSLRYREMGYDSLKADSMIMDIHNHETHM